VHNPVFGSLLKTAEDEKSEVANRVSDPAQATRATRPSMPRFLFRLRLSVGDAQVTAVVTSASKVQFAFRKKLQII
jgi:hypothetical protein